MARRSRSTARPWPLVLRVLHARPRIVLAAAVLATASALLPVDDLVTRLLVAWDLAVATHLGMALSLMRGATVGQIRARAAIEDEGSVGVLVLTVGAALASLVAIAVVLSAPHVDDPDAHLHRLSLALVTILLSWAFIHVVFALHYAHEYYGETGERTERRLRFPDDEDPDYWDFVYFSFVIGMTSQVSDVAIANRAMRRTATAHGITSFLFNLVLLSLTINVAASFLTGE